MIRRTLTTGAAIEIGDVLFCVNGFDASCAFIDRHLHHPYKERSEHV